MSRVAGPNPESATSGWHPEGRIVSEPEKPHRCHPPAATYLDSFDGTPKSASAWTIVKLSIAEGTMWQCNCGRFWIAAWVAGEVAQDREWVSLPRVEWHPETKRERKQRLKVEK